jgi:hypothetical protein
MSNRREFLKLLGLGAIAPVIPKIPVESTKAVTSGIIPGKIKVDKFLANIEGPERMRISSIGIVDIHDEYMRRYNQFYEQQIWSGNAVTNKNK